MDQQTEVAASEAADNPLLEESSGPFGVPAFGRVRPDHFREAFPRAFAAHTAEVAAIAGATSNAFFRLTGKRLRHLPFTPERVLATLKA